MKEIKFNCIMLLLYQYNFQPFLQNSLGGRVRFLISGSAPLRDDVMVFLRCALGCQVSQQNSFLVGLRVISYFVKRQESGQNIFARERERETLRTREARRAPKKSDFSLAYPPSLARVRVFLSSRLETIAVHVFVKIGIILRYGWLPGDAELFFLVKA